MNTNPPTDDTILEPNMPMIINIQRKYKSGIVQTATGKKFPVTLQDWLLDGIKLYDYVDLKKSSVTGEWIVVDYHVNSEVYGAIHNSYQDTLDDLCYSKDGEVLWVNL